MSKESTAIPGRPGIGSPSHEDRRHPAVLIESEESRASFQRHPALELAGKEDLSMGSQPDVAETQHPAVLGRAVLGVRQHSQIAIRVEPELAVGAGTDDESDVRRAALERLQTLGNEGEVAEVDKTADRCSCPS